MVAVRAVDAGPDLGADAGDLAGPQIAHGTLAQRAGTGVADAHPAAVGQDSTGVLAGNENRCRAITFNGCHRPENVIVPPSPASPARTKCSKDSTCSRSETPGRLEVCPQRIEHLAQARTRRFRAPPVGAEIVEVLRLRRAALAGHALCEP